MLRRVTPDGPLPQAASVRIADANPDALFAHSLEFNAPVHNNWNIVHVGMLVPESHQIYICGDNCMRGVTMTAAEMGAADRFSMVVLTEKDLLHSDLTAVTLAGVTDVLNKLPKLPRAVLVFPVCAHHFLGSNMDYVYEKLRARFPTVDFIPCWMDPIMQKRHLSPDQKERCAIYEVLPELPLDPRSVNVLGGVLCSDDQYNDIARLAAESGAALRELPRCRTYDEFLAMGRGAIQVCANPMGVYGAKYLAKRLKRPFLDMPCTFDLDAIATMLNHFAAYLAADAPVCAWRDAAERALRAARQIVGERPIAIDAMAVFRPLELAKLLCEYDFQVKAVYLDAVTPAEKPAFDWLKRHRPDLRLTATSRVEMRVGASQTPQNDVIAIGPKSAYFENTAHFVQMIENGGFWGYGGIVGLCERMVDAANTPKDTRALVPLKGWGWKGGMTAHA